MIRFSRTFHPVGQGAFYSERFSFSEDFSFLTIYDCGTDLRNPLLGTPSQIQERLKSRINQDLGPSNPNTNKHGVQLLFISHFDEDHVSGVQFLNPKVVIIPLLNQDEITFYEILDFLKISNINMNLLRNPKRFFGPGTTVVGVRPEDEEENFAERGEIEINEEGRLGNTYTGTNRDYPNVDIVLPSGSVILMAKIWQYIVFNPKLSKLNQFKNELAKAGWNWSTLSEDLKSNLDQNKVKELHDIYKKVSTDLNSTSLLVYSGPTDIIDNIEIEGQKVGPISCFYCKRRYYSRCHHCFYSAHFVRGIACMYFGDWKISKKKLQSYYSHIPDNGAKIGTIQIPHHGSIYNNGHYALEYLPNPEFIKCVISCGENNRFNHPSNQIIQKIMDYEGEVILVTENCTSSFIATYTLSNGKNKP